MQTHRAYFDNKLRDASVNVQRRQKTFDGFAKLPEEFSTEDVMRCFNLNAMNVARVKVTRLIKDHLAEKISGRKGEAGHKIQFYRKTGLLML